MVISTRQKFLAENCSKINIQLDGHPICRVKHPKSLGFIIDDRLSWSNHIKELCRKMSLAIGEKLQKLQNRAASGVIL